MQLSYQDYFFNSRDDTHRIQRRFLKKLNGFSLIQILMSLALSLVVLAGLFHWHYLLKIILIDSKDKREGLNTGRTVLQFMMNDLKYSGYLGCRSRDDNYPVRSHVASYESPYKFHRVNTAVVGFVATPAHCARRLPESACQRMKEGSDVLVIYNIPRHLTFLKYPLLNLEDDFIVDNAKSIRPLSLVLINDCYAADIFTVIKVNEGKISREKSPRLNESNLLSRAYAVGAEVVAVDSVAYYVGKTTRQKENQVVLSLFRDDLFQEAEEIIEGVTTLKMEYVLTGDDGHIHYQSSANIVEKDWPSVVGVRVTVITDKEVRWIYEFSIRNRHHSYPRFSLAQYPFFDSVSFNDGSDFKLTAVG
jgi:hypothetical protein